MSQIIQYLGLLFLLPLPAFADSGKLSVFRWNEGYRAERTPVLEQPISEQDFRILMEEGRLPENEAIFRGCYLAHFRAPAARTPASLGKPESEMYRVCVR